MTKPLYASLLALITIAIVSLVAPRQGSAQTDTGTLAKEPVLLELFTSQGCSSCPPADRLAAKLAKEPGLVVISRPVDYWDRLGWKDTFAKPSNTALQRQYARRGLSGYNGVYTPQTVVAGLLGEVGSNERTIRRFAKQAAQSNRAAIRVRRREDGGFGIGLAGKAQNRTDLVLMGVSGRETVAIGRGENGGRRVTYTNVLISEKRVAQWDGGPASHRITPAQLITPGADRYALVLREPNGGRVLAASWLP
ncbi:MAG: DUF1223 domain-containing protein [Pseudomonadota bacterium]